MCRNPTLIVTRVAATHASRIAAEIHITWIDSGGWYWDLWSQNRSSRAADTKYLRAKTYGTLPKKPGSCRAGWKSTTLLQRARSNETVRVNRRCMPYLNHEIGGEVFRLLSLNLFETNLSVLAPRTSNLEMARCSPSTGFEATLEILTQNKRWSSPSIHSRRGE